AIALPETRTLASWVMETREDPARLHSRQFTKQSHLARAAAAGIPHKLRTLFAAARLLEGFLDRGRYLMHQRRLTDCSTNSICTIWRQSIVSYRPIRSNTALSRLV